MRRQIDPAFTVTADDLRLPARLLTLRRAHEGDDAINAQLDAVFDAVVAGDVAGARALLDEIEAGG